MVLNPHAQSVDKDSNHDSTAKVFTVHDLPKGLAHHLPKFQQLVGVLVPRLPLGWLSFLAALGVLCEFIGPITVRIHIIIIRGFRFLAARAHFWI